ncbi:MAG: MraY family glycosyltransferase [Phycisphaerales bacterium]
MWQGPVVPPLSPVSPVGALPASATGAPPLVVGAIELLNSFIPVFVVAFFATLLMTPVVRRMAVAADVIDHPDQTRKLHAYPIAYLGGLAVFFGVLMGVAASYVLVRGDAAALVPLPISIVVGMVAIAFTGLADDIWKWDPRLKIAGQLVAAAALAVQDFGTRVAQGMLTPLMGDASTPIFHLSGNAAITNGDVYYWVGVAIVAFFVLGGCNAANLIDGLDGLLSGSVAIMAVGFLLISLLMGMLIPVTDTDNTLVAARVALSLALLGAVLGFLPFNFNPAVIFLGDAGSLLLGYLCVTLILMFGEHMQIPLVLAGLIIFSLPILDTMLAIIRRRLAGVSFSTADSNHIHHQMKRAMGSVRKAVLALYGMTAMFTLLGVALAAVRLLTNVRLLVIIAVTSVVFAFVAAVAIKTARMGAWTLAERRRADGAEPGQGQPAPAAAAPGSAEAPVTAASSARAAAERRTPVL